jgi:hypothetical protein
VGFERAGPALVGLSKVAGAAAGVIVELLTGPALNANENTMLDKTKGIPPDAVKLKKDQG